MAYGDRRQPTTSSQRRTFNVGSYRGSRQGQKLLGVKNASHRFLAGELGADIITSPIIPGVGIWVPGEKLIPPLSVQAVRRIGAVSASSVASLASAAVDPVSAIEAAVPGISSLFSSADGGPDDRRVVLLAQAYQQAVAGLNVATPYPGTGLPYLQNWLTDVPAHPGYSNQIAQQLITAVQTRNPAAAAAAVPVNIGPAYDPVTGAPVPTTYAGAGGAMSGSTLLLLGGVALAAVLFLRK